MSLILYTFFQSSAWAAVYSIFENIGIPTRIENKVLWTIIGQKQHKFLLSESEMKILQPVHGTVYIYPIDMHSVY